MGFLKGVTATLAAAAAGGAAAEPITRADVDPLFARFNAETPGCAVGVMQDGKPVVLQGYGMADLEAKRPITSHTLFDLASITKQFTGAAIAMLALEGKLSEDDDIRKYLPEMRDYGAPITIRHLLHHTSGIRDYSSLDEFNPPQTLTQDQIVQQIARQSALNVPTGSEHLYSNSNYVLLAEIVQRVSGTDFESFLTKRFFEPLGMKHTGFRAPDLAVGYVTAEGGGYRRGEPRVDKWGSSGIVTTIEDLMLWFDNLETGKVGGRALIDRMSTVGKLADGTPLTYAYGIGVRRDYRGVQGLTLLTHNGSLPAVGIATTMAYFPGERFGVAYLCNAPNAPLSSWAKLLEKHLGSRLPQASASMPSPPPPAAAPAAPGDLAAFAGIYRDPVKDQVRSFLVENGALVLETGGRKYPLDAVGAGEFSLGGMARFLFRPNDSGRMAVEEQMGGDTLRFAAVQPAGTVDAAAYAGVYRSPDVAGTIRISATASGLVATTAREEVPLTPLYKDAFTNGAEGWVNLSFVRGASGAVEALTLTTPNGLRRMRFERE